jgi:hypothetical protein
VRDVEAQGAAPIGRLIETALSGLDGFIVLSSRAEEELADDRVDFRAAIFGADGPEQVAHQQDVSDVEAAVVILPPWGRMRQPTREPFMSRDYAEQFVSSFLDSHESAGHVAFLVPANIATNQSSKPFRDYLTARWDLALVAFAPCALPGLHSAFAAALIVVVPKGTGEGLVRFFRTGTDGLDDAALAGLGNLLRRKGGRNEYGFILRQMAPDSGTWAFDVNDPAHRERAAELVELGELRTVDDVFEVRRAGGTPGKSSSGRRLHGSDVARNQRLPDPEDWDGQPAFREPTPLEVGDFVMPAIIGPSGPGPKRTIPVGRIGAEHLPAGAADSVIVLRPREPMSEPEVEFVLAYLRSTRMSDQVHAEGLGGNLRLSPTLLRDVPLPRPDSGLLHAVVELVEARKELEDLAALSTSTIDTAFTLPTARAARAHIVEVGRELRQRADAVRQLDDLGYRIRTRYPYPVAHHWRTVEAALSASDDGEALSAILECYEVLIGFVAGTVVVAIRAGGHTVGARDNLAKVFRQGRGPTLGTWKEIVESTEGRWSAGLAEDDYLVQVRTFSETTTKQRTSLTRLRNDLAHLRKPSDRAAAAESGIAALRDVLDAARFLTDISLIWVTNVNANVLSGRSIVKVERLVGDHRTVPSESLELDRVNIELHSLYLTDVLGGFHLLRPVFVGEICRACGAWHTFHVDGLEGETIRYRGFEGGHVVKHAEMRRDLAAVGLA